MGTEESQSSPTKYTEGGLLEDWRSINCQLGGFHKKITQLYWGGGRGNKEILSTPPDE